MTNTVYEQVVKLTEKLSPEEHEELIQHLKAKKAPEQDSQEFHALFHSMVVDFGPIAPDFSCCRDYWHK